MVATVFCMEYSCETLEGYYRAIQSATSLIEDGGYLVQGGVMGETSETSLFSYNSLAFQTILLEENDFIVISCANTISWMH